MSSSERGTGASCSLSFERFTYEAASVSDESRFVCDMFYVLLRRRRYFYSRKNVGIALFLSAFWAATVAICCQSFGLVSCKSQVPVADSLVMHEWNEGWATHEFAFPRLSSAPLKERNLLSIQSNTACIPLYIPQHDISKFCSRNSDNGHGLIRFARK